MSIGDCLAWNGPARMKVGPSLIHVCTSLKTIWPSQSKMPMPFSSCKRTMASSSLSDRARVKQNREVYRLGVVVDVEVDVVMVFVVLVELVAVVVVSVLDDVVIVVVVVVVDVEDEVTPKLRMRTESR
mmetsp:Transcript_5050/g.11499  ORF Transcript_5050/g.11499 Transcript_5050/m.11499 type:complete len:128 (-) Transcript_5050:98-481(-)